MARELPRSLACSLAVHLGIVVLALVSVRSSRRQVSSRPDLIAARFLVVEDAPSPTPPGPLTSLPNPPAPPQPVSEPPVIHVPEAVPAFEPEAMPLPIQPITTTKRNSPPAPGAARTRRPGPMSSTQAATAGNATSRGPAIARPRYAMNPPPVYPPEARRLKQQGEVLLRVRVGLDGNAQDVTLKRSSGFPLLDEAAIVSVRRWKFEPASVAGMAVTAQVNVPVRFQLKL